MVILIARFKDGEVDMFLDQFMDGEFEGAGFELFLQGDGDHDNLVAWIRFVSCHVILQLLIRQFQRFALPALGRAAGRRPIGKMLRRRKKLGIAPESPASSARFVGRSWLDDASVVFIKRFDL